MIIKLSDYLTVADAAKYLGVNKNTLRDWERKGKITTFRNPLNKYRLYLIKDLDELLAGVKR